MPAPGYTGGHRITIFEDSSPWPSIPATGAQFQAVTANRLNDGIVVYLTAGGRWSESLQEAAVAEGKEAAEALLARAEPAVADNSIVEPYRFRGGKGRGRHPRGERARGHPPGRTDRPARSRQAGGIAGRSSLSVHAREELKAKLCIVTMNSTSSS